MKLFVFWPFSTRYRCKNSRSPSINEHNHIVLSYSVLAFTFVGECNSNTKKEQFWIQKKKNVPASRYSNIQAKDLRNIQINTNRRVHCLDRNLYIHINNRKWSEVQIFKTEQMNEKNINTRLVIGKRKSNAMWLQELTNKRDKDKNKKNRQNDQVRMYIYHLLLNVFTSNIYHLAQSQKCGDRQPITLTIWISANLEHCVSVSNTATTATRLCTRLFRIDFYKLKCK